MKSNEVQPVIKANFKQAKVLVIDDNDDQWLLMKHAMQQCLAEVTLIRVATPAQALSLLGDWENQEWEIPKLILLDLYLPDSQDGWGLLKHIKNMGAPINHIPIIMFSTSAVSTDIREAYRLGVSSYLVKPVEFSDWLTYFQELRTYWWETVTLPPLHYTL